MRTLRLVAGLVLASAVCVAIPAKADTVTESLGTQNFTGGTKVLTGTFLTAVATQPAPFNAFCGSDTASTLGNCSASWTFNYVVPSGDTVTGATLSLGILDLDSAAAGDQIASFTLNGLDDLTSIINTVANGLDGGTGSPNSFYEVLTIIIPGADLAELGGTSATFALQTKGPGLGVLGNTTFNGVGLDFSTLSLTVTPGTTPPPPMPEPSSLALCLAGVAAAGFAKVLLHR
jgi:hypothetical protein